MNRREASKKETRKLILDVARRLFAVKGMEECTIRDIARAAGVSPASVVVHFKSKTALLEVALSSDIATEMSRAIASMPGDAPLPDRLIHLANRFFKFYDGNRNLYRAFIRSTLLETAGETPNVTRVSDRYIEFLHGMIEEEKTRGVVRAEVDSMVVAASIFSLYLGALVTFFRVPEMTVEMTTDILAAMTNQYLEGIMTSERG